MNPEIDTESFEVTSAEAGERLDKFLSVRYSPHFSRSYFARLIEQDLVLVNGAPSKKRVLVAEGDLVEVFFALSEPSDIQPENIPLDIVYEDEHLLVVNKPKNMVVHPAPGNWTGTFVNALIYHSHVEKDGTLRPGIVHRLDKDTTGLLIGAKTTEAQRKMVALFSSRAIFKEYRAITIGSPPEGRVETLIGRNPKKRQEMAVVSEKGKKAITEIKVIEKKGDLAHVSCVIETGRTHQIRVHLQYLKTPVLGDKVYGFDKVNEKYKAITPYLHAYRLKFIHPFTQKELQLEAPLPKEFL